MKENDDNTDRMERHNSRIAKAFGHGCQKSPDASRTVVTSGSLHGPGVEEPCQSASSSEPQGRVPGKKTSKLEGCRKADEAVSGFAGEGPVRTRDVDVLGSPQVPTEESLREENHRLQNLQPSALTSLLNLTPLGIVTSERQVYRHRKRAGLLGAATRRVNFFCYLAWLILVGRSWASMNQKRTPPEKGDCDLKVKDVLELIKNASYRCALTGRKLTPETASLDHCIPVCRGGEHAISNAQLLHRDVNRAKGTLTNEEFISLCRDVVRHARRKQYSLEAERPQE